MATKEDVEEMAIDQDVEGVIAALNDKDSDTVVAAAKALGNMENKKAIEPLVNIYFDERRAARRAPRRAHHQQAAAESWAILRALEKIGKKHDLNPSELDIDDGIEVCPRCKEWYDSDEWDSPVDEQYCEGCIEGLDYKLGRGNY